MTEMCILLLLFLTMVFGVLDFGRLMYDVHSMNAAAQAAARQLTLPAEAQSDCDALRAALSNGGGISLSVDPASASGNTSSGYSTPPGTSRGYVYVYPAMSSAGSGWPSDWQHNCSSSSARPSGTVIARISYSFQPWTPLINAIVHSVTVTRTSVLHTEY